MINRVVGHPMGIHGQLGMLVQQLPELTPPHLYLDACNFGSVFFGHGMWEIYRLHQSLSATQ